MDAAAAPDHHQPIGEHKRLDLVHGGRGAFAALLAHEVDDAELVGYGQLTGSPGSPGLETVVHPAHRGYAEHIGRALLSAALDEVAHRGGGTVTYWIAQPTPEQEADAEAAGFVAGRRLLQLRVALPLEAPVAVAAAGLALSAFVPGRDEEPWLTVNNRAFAGHHEQGAWTIETILDREEEPWFDPSGFLMHWEDGRLAGSCWTKVHADTDPAMGEIYVISVDPDFARRGLGRALTVAGLNWIAGQGLGVGMLYVDDSNTTALSLYESLGFTLHHADRAYLLEVPQAT